VIVIIGSVISHIGAATASDMRTVMRLRWFILALCPMVYAERLPPAVVHQPFQHLLPAEGALGCTGFQPVFLLAGGELPSGVRLERDGRITGEPVRVASGSFSVKVTTPCSERVSDWEWTVRGAPMLFVEPAEISLSSAASQGSVLVVSSWPGLAYSVTTRSGAPLPPWLRACPRRGRTPREGSALAGDRLELIADPSLAPPDVSVQLVIHAWNGKDPALLTVLFSSPTEANP
jgi:hypothetical protein